MKAQNSPNKKYMNDLNEGCDSDQQHSKMKLIKQSRKFPVIVP